MSTKFAKLPSRQEYLTELNKYAEVLNDQPIDGSCIDFIYRDLPSFLLANKEYIGEGKHRDILRMKIRELTANGYADPGCEVVIFGLDSSIDPVNKFTSLQASIQEELLKTPGKTPNEWYTGGQKPLGKSKKKGVWISGPPGIREKIYNLYGEKFGMDTKFLELNGSDALRCPNTTNSDVSCDLRMVNDDVKYSSDPVCHTVERIHSIMTSNASWGVRISVPEEFQSVIADKFMDYDDMGYGSISFYSTYDFEVSRMSCRLDLWFNDKVHPSVYVPIDNDLWENIHDALILFLNRVQLGKH